MKLIIDIPESRYRLLQKQAKTNLGREKLDEFAEVVLNGTPLPKGHGRLIDAGEYVDVLNNAQIEGLNTYEGLGRAKELLIETHTIIEADKAESEVQE